MIANFWKAAYKVINRTNTVLGRIDGIEINTELANRYKLECKFIRAYLVVNIFFWFTQDVVRFRDADLFQYQWYITVDAY